MIIFRTYGANRQLGDIQAVINKDKQLHILQAIGDHTCILDEASDISQWYSPNAEEENTFFNEFSFLFLVMCTRGAELDRKFKKNGTEW